jgi:hypothetical protein
LLEEGKHCSAGELAEAEGVTRSFVNRLLRLTLLAPTPLKRSSTADSQRACSWRT